MPAEDMFRAPVERRPLRRRIFSFAQSIAVHLLGLALLMRAPGARPALASPATTGRPDLEVFMVPGPDPAGTAGLQPTSDEADAFLPITDPPSNLSLDNLSFDLRKITAHATLLFPFITPGLALERLLVPPSKSLRLPAVFQSSEDAGASNADRTAPPLDQSARQALVDRAWARRERWQAFQAIANAAAQRDANGEDLSTILQMYREQNGLQPYVDHGVKDYSFWVYLGLAADHVDFIDYISRYVREHPGSRASTELLLLLDAIALGSVEDLLVLRAIDPQADLQTTVRVDPRAFAFVVRIQEYYKEALARRNLTTEASIRAYYDTVRLVILDIVLRTTPDGYRAGDARFLMGEIYWRRGNMVDAERVWRDLKPDPSDTYVTPSRVIAERIDTFDVVPSDRLAIDRALDTERSRWRAFSYDRLKQFGYRFDSY